VKALRELARRIVEDDGLRQAAGSASLTFMVTLILEGFQRALTTSAVVFLVVYFITHIG
jgi:hypothetical protein